jgi:hypothetical protein
MVPLGPMMFWMRLPIYFASSVQMRSERLVHRAGDEVRRDLVLVERISEPRLDHVGLLRVVATLLPQLVDREL